MAMSVSRGENASRLTFCIPRNNLDCPRSILAPGNGLTVPGNSRMAHGKTTMNYLFRLDDWLKVRRAKERTRA